MMKRIRDTSATFRDITRAVGCLVWSAFARRHPLCFFPLMLDALRIMGADIQSGARTWTSPATDIVTPAFVKECEEALKLMHTSFVLQLEPVQACTIFSDARVDAEIAEWAYCGEHWAVQGKFDARHHIFFHELAAASQALLDIARAHPAGHVVLGVDNTAAMFALRSGHSGNHIADQWLRRFYQRLPSTFSFVVLHVSTDINPADRFTRGTVGTIRCESGDRPGRRAREYLQQHVRFAIHG